MNNKNIIWLYGVTFLILVAGSALAATKDDVVKRDYLQCGVSTGVTGFSTVDEKGNWSGLDVDICRAVAAATLGDATKVKYLPLAENECFTALLSGEVDILSRNSTWTFSRDSALAVNFPGVSYFDGQGLLVAEKIGVKRITDLKKVEICNQVGSAMEDNLIDYFTRNEIEYKNVPFDTLDLAVKGFTEEKCDVITLQQSMLYGVRLGLEKPDSAVVLPEVISKEPLGPVVRQGDDNWFNIVRWTLFAMLNAEELGVGSANIEMMKVSNTLAVKRLLGQEGTGGKGLGLKDDWAFQIIKQVGNYGDVFDRNLGPKSLLGVDRGLNRLWSQGGVQYAPPLR